MQNKFMKAAVNEAKKAAVKDEVPIGAVIVYDGKIIARGHNTRQKTQNAVNHAEIIAIQKACKKIGSWRLIDCDIYVTLEPCPMCAGAIGWSQLGRLVFGAEDEKRGYKRFAPDVLHPKTEVVSGVCAEECTALMKEFFKNKR